MVVALVSILVGWSFINFYKPSSDKGVSPYGTPPTREFNGLVFREIFAGMDFASQIYGDVLQVFLKSWHWRNGTNMNKSLQVSIDLER